ncbi:Pimeloyl-ACP methyl ester carboxylesterase [Chitinophaga terrae (ex Kim and Jung 2007)]|uniref:Pimeloyl-ACP methyl ester carboxylesterase n=1 Tax=Chitinophaga terrae (ex Kim and Jung 2007) TaxID=408074 RepID=A0A1H4EDB8_9BACT|nr:alpha/beta hydrolase [Chitinophaga terrae (ex Kim and Jung 2007)]GEP91581.1 hydrolase [Chitinophaga terrae (ex Kim and Jung 2007)]SEA82946.1 Pimeloyl-ACP methyl ester carboxylesterase [Chitinophaga terrae (ex Kim and Jung 2007)]
MKKLTFRLLAMLLMISANVLAQEIPVQDIYLTNYKYPYPVHFLPLHIQGQQLKMAYMDVQPSKPNGKTIVLLHGKNFSGAYWDSTAADLSNNGYRVIIPDQIGFGKSSKPKTFQYSFQQLAQNTKALLDTLGIKKTAILGHSMGGMLATRFALMYPDVTEKLILENPIGLEDWKTVVPYQSVDQWYKGELQQSYAKIKQYMMDSYYAGKWTASYDKWAKLQASWIGSPDYNVVAWNSALTYDMIFTQPVLYEFPNLKMPTLLIIGQRDRTALGKASVPENIRSTLGNYPQLGENAAKAIHHATLVPIEGVGHLPHIEAYPKFIAPLLDFLR